MSALDGLRFRLGTLLRPGQFARDLDEELRFHVALEAMQKECAARGELSPEDARFAALRRFGARRIAVASRWSEQLNQALIAYLEHAEIEVLSITSVGQWAQQAFSMSIEEGVKLAFQLGREAMRKAPDAEALLVAGGAWRSLAAVPILEEDFGIPVVTNPIAQVWRLIERGVAPPVKGWGMLLAHGTMEG